ncbi:hypothetical protein [Marinimicrobium sp. ABcell2]|uniref:hypothetical protein n=1 Tax=Marinimicrobium sp. ABcell2 TaxID=3069751 RepID=UPI0027B87744|nr:hypothetical protein [Marinimicrobium sp. ABcell2]MDQ2077107.1 hypothetical protein [Marinimicrobium sp. ABcell2]
MAKHRSLQGRTTEFLLYTAPTGAIKVEVLLSGETLWLTQATEPSACHRARCRLVKSSTSMV